ncbi:MAG: hypothetical protein A3G43_08025 [Ignavibacteria bacterium RIFCSPLOWO2_12_FULL_56_21]|nr:MAG: hypothetical protein A3G43_08025 [Ignavibacteria bacterium RIFCSPLOWO2_12_FULL_56_21]
MTILRLALIFALISPGFAQVSVKVPLSYYLPTGAAYDPAIPTPEAFFGFQVGERHLQPDQIHAYFRALDKLSDRFAIEEMGRTHEHREIILAVVTSPENHGNIAKIREEHLRLSDPSASAPDVEHMPVVVWMGYSVHGNEASGSHASVLVAYYLAAARGPEIDALLGATVVLLNPSINPDGLNRFASWVNANRGAVVVASPDSREHNEPWPGGRTNHYWFDLNRDWMPLQHPESRARIERYYEWRPNLLTDHHEMGTNSTFFFQPGIPSRNNPLTPPGVMQLTQRLAEFHAKALDATGALYYSGESYDDFYVGKGSSYPDITGGVGVLFEQASSRGHAQESSTGVLTFPYAIRNHVTASLSSLRGAQAMRVDLLKHQRESAFSALKLADQAPVKGYVFGSKSDPVRTQLMLDVLLRHKIEVRRLSKTYRDGGEAFESEFGYVLPARQPQYRLVTALFERRTSFEDSLFYDVSAWTLPLAFGVPYAEVRGSVQEYAGEKVGTAVIVSGRFTPAQNAVAYALPWQPTFAPRAVERLLEAGIQVRIAVRSFDASTSSGPKAFGPGTVVVPLGIQGEKRGEIENLLTTIATSDAVVADAVATGMSDNGVDLGSPNLLSLKLPKVAILAGSGVSAIDAGELWHELDQRFGIPVVLIDPASLGRVNIGAFTVLVMPGGNYSALDSAGCASLIRWVEQGNTLIGLEQAIEWLVSHRLVGASIKKRPEAKRDEVPPPRPYALENEYRDARNVPGTIVNGTVDLTHPLLFGYDRPTMALFKSSGLVLEMSKSPFATPVRFTDNPLIAGYLHTDTRSLIAGGGSVQVNTMRNGRIIVMTDAPTFRAFWYGTSRIFLNAVMFGQIIRTSSTRPMQ